MLNSAGESHYQGVNVMNDIGTRLSTLWVVVMFNMVFADILSFIKPGVLQEMWAGEGGVQVTPGCYWLSRSS